MKKRKNKEENALVHQFIAGAKELTATSETQMEIEATLDETSTRMMMQARRKASLKPRIQTKPKSKQKRKSSDFKPPKLIRKRRSESTTSPGLRNTNQLKSRKQRRASNDSSLRTNKQPKLQRQRYSNSASPAVASITPLTSPRLFDIKERSPTLWDTSRGFVSLPSTPPSHSEDELDDIREASKSLETNPMVQQLRGLCGYVSGSADDGGAASSDACDEMEHIMALLMLHVARCETCQGGRSAIQHHLDAISQMLTYSVKQQVRDVHRKVRGHSENGGASDEFAQTDVDECKSSVTVPPNLQNSSTRLSETPEPMCSDTDREMQSKAQKKKSKRRSGNRPARD